MSAKKNKEKEQKKETRSTTHERKPLERHAKSTSDDDIVVPSHINPKWVKYYKRLIQLREDLLNQKRSLSQASTTEIQPFGMHMADSGTDNFDRDFALSLLSSDQDLLYEIEEAIKRIENNTYGICELTGKPIPKARLDAIPWARFTKEAQEQLEREGALHHKPRLRPVGIIEPPTVSESETEESESENEKE